MHSKKIDYDRVVLRSLIGSMTIIVIVSATMLISWLLDIDINSVYLWTGALLAFLVFYFIYTAPLYFKIPIIFGAIFGVSSIAFFLLGWPIQFSLMLGLAVVILMLSVYLSI